MAETILHPDYFEALGSAGDTLQAVLTERSDDVVSATRETTDPDVSIVIRTRNECGRLASLLADIDNQSFSGEKQVLVVDSGSSDRTREVAREFGAEVVPINQDTFSHPKALNLGFEASDHPYVLSLVGHSNLAVSTALKGLTRWMGAENFAAAYAPAMLPDEFSSRWERQVNRLLWHELRNGPAGPVPVVARGAMISNRTVYAKETWKELGGFDERYGAGGEDKALAYRMMESGATIVREPVLTIHHSHALGLIGTIRQVLYHRSLSKPQEFDSDRLRYRPIVNP